MKPLHRRLVLYSDGEEAYIFTPVDNRGAPALTILRASGEISLDRPNTHLAGKLLDSGRSIYGIVGIISLSLFDYMVVITGRVQEAHWMGHDIFRATEFDILPINSGVSARHPPHLLEAHLLGLLRFHLKTGNFLFSYDWDLTRRLQAQFVARDSDLPKALWETADEQFFWNKFLQSRFIEATMKHERQDLSPFILPLMYGTFAVRETSVKGRKIQLCLISRRSRHRAGTRYFRRGIDHDGHVANFNETEQIVLLGSPPDGSATEEYAVKMSYVQIRGSVPVFWAEINTLRYKPDLQIMDLQETADSMRKHLEAQESAYGATRLVNLLNAHGHERPVKEAYERYLAYLEKPSIHYTHFDFHSLTKNMKYDELRVLTDQLYDSLLSDAYFHLDSTQPAAVKLQKGVVRTNCMDNLDRTNIVQTLLGRLMLTRQLQATGLLAPTESVDDFEGLAKDFRELWSDLGDLVSKAYSGSGAMKADFTRTNKRTKAGEFEDGYKGAVRYIKNNFFDGARQDAFDLFTGTWTPRRRPSTLHLLTTDTRSLPVRSMPYVVWYSLFMIAAGLTLPRTPGPSLLYYFAFWLTLLSLALIFIVLHGIEYVAWPRLVPLDGVIYYDGPGFRSGRAGMGLGMRGPSVAAKARQGAKRRWGLPLEIEMQDKRRKEG